MHVGEMLMENRSVSFICRLLLCRFANISKCGFFYGKKRLLIYDLIVAYHYRSLRLLLSHMLRVAPVTCTTTSAFTEANFCRNSLVRKYQ